MVDFLLHHYLFVNMYFVHMIIISSFHDTNRVSAIPQLTGHSPRWHTMLALPGQNNLVRHDLHGLRPAPLGGSSNVNSPVRRIVQEPEPASSSTSRPPRKPLVMPNLRGRGWKHSAPSETLQTRMASAAEAAAARARVTKRL